MKRYSIRNGIAALATLALLSGGAVAQKEGPQKPAQSPAHFQVRDPFINLNLRPQGQVGTRPTVGIDKLQPTVVGQTNPESPFSDPNQEAVEVAAPDVTITGIVDSAQGRQAIVQAGSNSQIVRVGQKLADYEVTAITSKGVTFSYASANFEVALASEF